MNLLPRFTSSLQNALAKWSIVLTGEQIEQMAGHYAEMVKTNEELNLTRLTEPQEAAVKLYADSLALLVWVRDAGVTIQHVTDVGTGAGFPAYPLAVARPQWTVEALDGRFKKVEFLSRVAQAYQVRNLRAQHRRAEDAGRRTSLSDLITVKAVGSLSLCLQLAQKLVRAGGYMVAYKTSSLPSLEDREAGRRASQLGFVEEKPCCYELECGAERMSRVLRIYRRLDSSESLLSRIR